MYGILIKRFTMQIYIDTIFYISDSIFTAPFFLQNSPTTTQAVVPPPSTTVVSISVSGELYINCCCNCQMIWLFYFMYKYA